MNTKSTIDFAERDPKDNVPVKKPQRENPLKKTPEKVVGQDPKAFLIERVTDRNADFRFCPKNLALIAKAISMGFLYLGDIIENRLKKPID